LISERSEFLENLKYQIDRRDEFLKKLENSFIGQSQERYRIFLEQQYRKTYTELLNEFLNLIKKK